MRHRRSRLEGTVRACGALLCLALLLHDPTAGAAGESGAFPVGDVFRPLLADPKQPQFFFSLNRFTSEGERYTLASVGFGETFGRS